MSEGRCPPDAYASAARRMAWPVTASTITTLAVFLPLLFWPGTVGEFMKFLPITVILALTASLALALLFIPVLGGTITQRLFVNSGMREGIITRQYAHRLRRLLRKPAKMLGAALLAMVAAYASYMLFGKGLEFCPDVEPEFALIQVHARSDLSVHEKDMIVRQVERPVLDMPELEAV